MVPLTKFENLSINNFMSRLLLLDGCKLASSLANMAAHVIWGIGLRASPALVDLRNTYHNHIRYPLQNCPNRLDYIESLSLHFHVWNDYLQLCSEFTPPDPADPAPFKKNVNTCG
jgi:hypothetical protein